MYGPAYWKAGTDGETLKGCWFEDSPEPCLDENPEFLVGFGDVEYITKTSSWRNYHLIENRRTSKQLPDQWEELHRLDDADSRDDSVLVDPHDGKLLKILENIRGYDDIFLDLRNTEVSSLSALQTLPVRAYLQSANVEQIPPYYPESSMPRWNHGEDPLFLLLHGYTGNPGNWDYMIEHLAGHNYFTPLLPGHALEPEQFANYTSSDWKNSVQYWSERFMDEHRTKIAVGLSMGGALSLLHWQNFDAIVLINTPIRIPDWKRMLIPLYEWVKTYHQFEDSEKVIPVQSLRDLQQVLYECREMLSEVDVPVLVINHRQDQTVSTNHGRVLVSKLNNAEHLVMEKGIHESPTDPEVAKMLNKEIMDWLKKQGITVNT